MDSKPKIIYVTDPMCSWCWAFSPEISALREQYASTVEFDMMPGILRSGGRPLTAQQAASLANHWHKLAQQTGQQFNADFHPPASFIYDTEPACRALITLRDLYPATMFDYLAALHSAFYVRHVDITLERNLTELACQFGVNAAEFDTHLRSDKMRAATREACSTRMELGVDGFPTLLLRKNKKTRLLAHGYQKAEQVSQMLESLLQQD